MNFFLMWLIYNLERNANSRVLHKKNLVFFADSYHRMRRISVKFSGIAEKGNRNLFTFSYFKNLKALPTR